MKKYFTFDDEPISGWMFFGRNLLGAVGMIFIIPGLWIFAANGYKRAGTFQWSKRMRITSAIAVVLTQVTFLLTQKLSEKLPDMNHLNDIVILLLLLQFFSSIITLILFFKNGNKNLA